ncbi:MAG: FMN-binding protein, partial [Dehalococcoidia bacterium]
MARKVNRRLLALGSAAIVSVYAVGFARTSGSAANTGAGLSLIPVATSGTAPQPVDAATAIAQAIANGAPAATQTAASAQTVNATRPPAATQSTAAAYRDGTYAGSGTSRLGDIAVAVTVQGGQIAAVRITNSTTHYSVSRIAQLPGEVLAKQSASVQLV